MILELINEFSKAEGYKINRNSLNYYALTMKNQKEKLKKTTHSPFPQKKKIKYLSINLPKEKKDLHAENYSTMMKERKMAQIESYIMLLDWKNQYCENNYTIQSLLQIQCNPYQITNSIFHRTRKKNFTVCLETQKTLNSQSNLEKEKCSWRNLPS